MSSEIARRYESVLERVASAAARAGRDARDVKVVAVSKSFAPDAIRDAQQAGIRRFGENRAQEFAQKVAVLGGDDIEWHFIGHLQTNKVRRVVGIADLVHSVDRYGLAEAISRRAAQTETPQEVLLEVNVSGEASKHGVEPARARHLAQEVADLPGLELRGLMAMAPLTSEPEGARPYFRGLRELLESIAADVPGVTELSMGMSRDLEIAVEEGATIVRVGRAIFGTRST